MTKNELIAKWIVAGFKSASAPGACTWGDQFPEAHTDLFRNYRPDMELEIIDKLKRAQRINRESLALLVNREVGTDRA